jgi:hypothetical protein
MTPANPRLCRPLLAALLVAAAAATAQQQAPPCATAEHRQFDFWAGDWQVTTPDGDLAGTNSIRPVLNGCALEESWHGAQGSIGKSLNMYDSRDGRWHQTWVDGNGGRLDLTGGLDERGRMVLSGQRPDPQGGAVMHEISWEQQSDDTVKQHWRVSKDGGEAWQDVFVGIYHPAGRAAPEDADGG